MKKETIKIKGMHCTSCAKLIEEALMQGGVTAKVNFDKSNADVSYDEKKISKEQIIKIITGEGYQSND